MASGKVFLLSVKLENDSYFRRCMGRSLKVIDTKGSAQGFLINDGDNHHLIFILSAI